MPVASTIAAVAGTVASVSAGAATLKQVGILGGGGKKKAAASNAANMAYQDSGKWGERFSGIMADSVNKQGSDPLGGLTRENLGSLAEKYPENPAYKLALKADDIFKPEITQVIG